MGRFDDCELQVKVVAELDREFWCGTGHDSSCILPNKRHVRKEHQQSSCDCTETYIVCIDNSRMGEIMQVNSWDSLTFLLAFLGFLVLFIGFGYFKGLLWFQQDGANETDNWFVSFESRDLASGGWFRRFGRPVIVLYVAHLLSYQVVTNLIVLSPFQFSIYVFVLYIPTNIILGIILITISWRIHRQPKVKENEPIQNA